MPSNGVSKPSGSRTDNIDRLRKAAEHGSLSSEKSESANQQAIVSDANPSTSTKPYPDENEAEQTQQNASVDDNPIPPCDMAIPSIEKHDIEMTDFGANRKTEDHQEPTQNGALGVQSETNRSDVRSSREQSIGSLGRGFKCLAILDPRMKNNTGRLTQSQHADPNDIVDGWGTWRGKSTFVIVREGPPEAARFTFKLRSGYANDRTANISDKDFRISEIKDRGVDGRKTFRYTSENVAGVFGTAFEDTGVRMSTRNPCSWARVEWQGLREEDMIRCKVSEGYSWIPKSDFERFCKGREATEAKLKEVISAPAVDNNGTPPSSRRNEIAGTSSNPVRLDEEMENVNSPAPSETTPAIATSNGMSKRDTPEPQSQTPIVEFSRAEFMKKRGSEKWKDMDPSEREKEEVRAEALYEIYKATMLEGGAREAVDSSTHVSVEEEL
ncbi:hypothetical protein N7476_000289 [Penicillium atrosanguineum]|uniref:Uncharacterized protein n=1 Tax=Penicillium atrosanguineum TaxID=1132637 RepID=A0A9W9QB82_9EURO|nr:hypothetical protein N7476_000289 [Penicillium atrosanguineum]